MFDTIIHKHYHGEDPATRRLLQLILKRLDMAKETLAELKTLVQGARTSLDNIRQDIARIAEGLPAQGLSRYEVEELKAELQGLASEADTLDKENEPEVDSPEGPEAPTE